eukprot:522183-Hanusia_phi.AAC.1
MVCNREGCCSSLENCSGYDITPSMKQVIKLSNIRLPPNTKLDESLRKGLLIVMSQAKADCKKVYGTNLRITKLNALKLFVKHHGTTLTSHHLIEQNLDLRCRISETSGSPLQCFDAKLDCGTPRHSSLVDQNSSQERLQSVF